MEEENTELRARLDKQQLAFHAAVVTRDGTIQELRRALAQQVASGSPASDGHGGMLHQLVTDLERQLACATRCSEVLADRLAKAKAAVSEERTARANSERENCALRRELEAIEASIHAVAADTQSSRCALPAPPHCLPRGNCRRL